MPTNRESTFLNRLCVTANPTTDNEKKSENALAGPARNPQKSEVPPNMTVVGDDIIMNCRACFQDGFGMKLNKQSNGIYVCAHNASHKYVIKDGFMKAPDFNTNTWRT